MAEEPEPWLRGPLADVHPLVQPVFFSFAQVREELSRHAAGLTRQQVWRRFGRSSIGFHLQHIAGSVDRLGTYLAGEGLRHEQLEFLRNESVGEASIEALLQSVDESLSRAEARLRAVYPATLYEVRTVGRQALPTSVIGLLMHLCEHTQRHLGQTITLAGLAREAG